MLTNPTLLAAVTLAFAAAASGRWTANHTPVHISEDVNNQSWAGLAEEPHHPLARRAEQTDVVWPLWQLSKLERDKDEEVFKYYYLDGAGSGVDVYVLDSGITHSDRDEFQDENGNDRVTDDFLYDGAEDGFEDATEGYGHGTGVASAIGGKTYGVAKSAAIFNVKMFGGEDEPPSSLRHVRAMNHVIARHNERKKRDGFKGSIINMSFRVSRTDAGDRVLNRAYAAGIVLVSAAGNNGYQPGVFPPSNQNVISVAASSHDYTPWNSKEGEGTGSNYGKHVDLWAPGHRVELLTKRGGAAFQTGTSFAVGYVTGILAIIYGVEGPDLSPSLAFARLMAQTDHWMELAPGQDWKGSPLAFANTGYRKGAAKDPPVKYIDGPEVDAASGTTDPLSTAQPTSTVLPTQGCQSPNHDEPFKPFTLEQGNWAASEFPSVCADVQLDISGQVGCMLWFDVCDSNDLVITMSVWQSVWDPELLQDITKAVANPDADEMTDVLGAILNDCDTEPNAEKWGGYKSIKVDTGLRMYNVSADTTGNFDPPTRFNATQLWVQGCAP